MNAYKFEDIFIGQTEMFEYVITDEMERGFKKITGDDNPLHYDDVFTMEVMGYGSHLVFGMLTASLMSTLAGVYLPGKYSLIHSIESCSFVKPVFSGDKLKIVGKVTDKLNGLNIIKVKVTILNQSSIVVLRSKMKIKVCK